MKYRKYVLKRAVVQFFAAFIDMFLYNNKTIINNKKKIKNILVISLDYIGDYAIRTTTAIYIIKKHFSDASISVMAGSWTSELVLSNPLVVKVIKYNPAWLNRSKKKWGLLKKVGTLLGLKKNRYDLIINVRGSIGISLWYLLRPARYIVRMQDFIKMLPQFFPQESIMTWDDVQKEAERRKKEFIVIPKDINESTKKLFITDGVDPQKRVISIHPGVHSKVKEWLPDRWAFVLDKLVDKYNAEILFCGDDNSKDYVIDVIRQMKSKVHNFAGKTTLPQLIALIQMSDLCISIDSGPMHIAGILDVPVVGLFGPNNPKTCHPLTTKCRLIFKNLPCADCIENMMGCNVECMKAITCDDVINAVSDLNKELRFFN